MRAIFKFIQPNDVEATMSITMTVGQWRALRDQLSGSQHPGWKLRSTIIDLLAEADRTFYVAEDKDAS